MTENRVVHESHGSHSDCGASRNHYALRGPLAEGSDAETRFPIRGDEPAASEDADNGAGWSSDAEAKAAVNKISLVSLH